MIEISYVIVYNNFRRYDVLYCQHSFCPIRNGRVFVCVRLHMNISSDEGVDI